MAWLYPRCSARRHDGVRCWLVAHRHRVHEVHPFHRDSCCGRTFTTETGDPR